MNTDVDAVVYLMLVNNLLHDVFPNCITIGEKHSRSWWHAAGFMQPRPSAADASEQVVAATDHACTALLACPGPQVRTYQACPPSAAPGMREAWALTTASRCVW